MKTQTIILKILTYSLQLYRTQKALFWLLVVKRQSFSLSTWLSFTFFVSWTTVHFSIARILLFTVIVIWWDCFQEFSWRLIIVCCLYWTLLGLLFYQDHIFVDCYQQLLFVILGTIRPSSFAYPTFFKITHIDLHCWLYHTFWIFDWIMSWRNWILASFSGQVWWGFKVDTYLWVTCVWTFLSVVLLKSKEMNIFLSFFHEITRKTIIWLAFPNRLPLSWWSLSRGFLNWWPVFMITVLTSLLSHTILDQICQLKLIYLIDLILLIIIFLAMIFWVRLLDWTNISFHPFKI